MQTSDNPIIDRYHIRGGSNEYKSCKLERNKSVCSRSEMYIDRHRIPVGVSTNSQTKFLTKSLWNNSNGHEKIRIIVSQYDFHFFNPKKKKNQQRGGDGWMDVGLNKLLTLQRRGPL